MIGPSGRDLYKTYPNLQRLGAKKKNHINKHKLQFRCLTCNGETPSLALKIVLLVDALLVRLKRELGVVGLSMWSLPWEFVKCFTKISSVKYFTSFCFNFTVWSENILQLTEFYNKTNMIKYVKYFSEIYFISKQKER